MGMFFEVYRRKGNRPRCIIYCYVPDEINGALGSLIEFESGGLNQFMNISSPIVNNVKGFFHQLQWF